MTTTTATAEAASRRRFVRSPPRLAARSADTTPLVILQHHLDTARLDAVVSARLEEGRMAVSARAKAKQLAASHRRTRDRVRVYRALAKEATEARYREAPIIAGDVLGGREQLRSHNQSRQRLRQHPDGDFEAQVMCAVNPKFVASAREATTATVSARRRLQSAQKRSEVILQDSGHSFSIVSDASFPSEVKRLEDEKEELEKGAKESQEKEEEEEEDLTQVTWEYLPDTQRTELSDSFPPTRPEREGKEQNEDDFVPPLLLTPGRSSHATSSAAPSTVSTIRSSRIGGSSAAAETARSLDLYFYPKLVATENAKAKDAGDERRSLACRRVFADLERETARRTRQQRHAERKAFRLKSEAERRRHEEERLQTLQQQQSEQQTEGPSDGPAVVKVTGSPQRAFQAARSRLRERCEAAGLSLPALCPCTDSPWDCEPDACAQNCPFFRNREGFLRTLRSLLPDEDEN